MSMGIACPVCGGGVGTDGRCIQCGAQALEPPSRWERVLMPPLVVIIIAANCAAAPFCLLFALAVFGLRLLWRSRRTGSRA